MDRKTEYQEWIKYADEDFETADLLNKQHHKTRSINEKAKNLPRYINNKFFVC